MCWAALPYSEDVTYIDVHVSRLRRRIEADPEQPDFIKTVPGEGYLFAAPMWCTPKNGSGGRHFLEQQFRPRVSSAIACRRATPDTSRDADDPQACLGRGRCDGPRLEKPRLLATYTCACGPITPWRSLTASRLRADSNGGRFVPMENLSPWVWERGTTARSVTPRAGVTVHGARRDRILARGRRIRSTTALRSADCECACRWRRRSRCTMQAQRAAAQARQRRWRARSRPPG